MPSYLFVIGESSGGSKILAGNGVRITEAPQDRGKIHPLNFQTFIVGIG